MSTPDGRAARATASIGAAANPVPAGTTGVALSAQAGATEMALAGHADAMARALAEAARAPEHGDVPVGAVVLHRGQVLAARHNERELRQDPTAHAELLALADAAAALGTWRLTEVTVVVTLEPCPMCAGALVTSRVGGLVFGATDPKAGACGSLYNLCADPRLHHEVPVAGGVLAERSEELLAAFFTTRRAGR